MNVGRKVLLGTALAFLGFGMAVPASAFWPFGSRRNQVCAYCGQPQTYFSAHAPGCYLAQPTYAPGYVPGVSPMPGMAQPGAAPEPGQPQPEGTSALPRTGQPGAAPTPEQPSTPGQPSTAGAGAGAAAAESAAAAAASEAAATDNTTPAPSSGLGGGLGAPQGAITMFGDLTPFTFAPIRATQATGFQPPAPPEPPPGRNFSIPVRSAPPVPTIRSFKIADNQTAFPVDRLTFNFNFYDYVNQALNQRFNIPLSRVRAYRYIFGFEKTFLDQRASVGMRLPLNNVLGNSNVPGVGNSSTALGDLAIYLKYAFLMDRQRGRAFSGGLAITTPTGPSSFAGANYLKGIHFTSLQPYLALQYQWDRAYIIGFSAIDVPTNNRDVTVYFNDLGLGYFVFRSPQPNAFVQAIAPTFEAHSNTPLNHTNPFNFRDIAGTSQTVDLTEGVNFFLRNRALLSLGVVQPVTGPRPFSIEALALFNWFF